jgi:magnesium transporter
VSEATGGVRLTPGFGVGRIPQGSKLVEAFYTDQPMKTANQPLPGIPWFDVDEPGSSDLDELAQRFQLHELQIEDCRHRQQRAKADEYETYMFTVLKHVVHHGQKLGFEDFDVFLGSDFLITVHQGDCPLLAKVCQRVQQNHVQRLDRVFYVLADLIVDEYLALLDSSAEQIGKVESQALQKAEPPLLREIFRLKRRLIEFRRSASGMRDVMSTIIRREGGLVGDDLDPYFRDVYDHLVRTVDLIESHRDLLTGSLDIYLSTVANRTNQVMKVLTVYGTLALPLVIITGFFGMNLHLPWSNNPLGVWYVGGLMLLSILAVLAYFKWKQWF